MILVVLEHDGQRLRKGALEAITRARQLNAIAGSVAGVLIGENLAAVAEEAKRYVQALYLAEVGPYTAEGWAAAAYAAQQKAGAQVVVATGSRQGRSWTPRLAYRMGAALLEDTLETGTDGAKVIATRYSFLNRVTEKQSAALPVVFTVKPNTTPLAEPLGSEGTVETLSVELPAVGVEVMERVVEQKKGSPWPKPP